MAVGLLAGQRVRRLYRAAGKVWVQPDDSPGLILERDGNMVLVQWSSGRREWLRSMDAEPCHGEEES